MLQKDGANASIHITHENYVAETQVPEEMTAEWLKDLESWYFVRFFKDFSLKKLTSTKGVVIIDLYKTYSPGFIYMGENLEQINT